MVLSFVSLSLFLLFSPLSGVLGAANTVHHSRLGEFRGQRTSVNKISVEAFLGVRYGEKPSRFQKPTPAWLNWNETTVHRARHWPVACVQQPGFLGDFHHNKESSEDCLFLNVWRPVQDETSADSLKPVFVFLHGGSFISDSISRKNLNGAQLAARLDAVVVTVNFRQDALGFLYAGEKQKSMAPGNQALWDQILALEWVQDVVDIFGGDPKRVTLAGQNSGATSVGVHVLSPLSRRYFQRALLQSGSVFSQLVTLNKKSRVSVAETWVQAAKKIDCGDGHHWTLETFDCLRGAPMKSILKMLDPLAQVSTAPQFIFDDEILPFENILEAFDSLANSVGENELDVFVGATDDEGSVVLPVLNMGLFEMLSPKAISTEDARSELEKYAKMLVTPTGNRFRTIDGASVAAHYFNPTDSNSEKMTNLHRAVGRALGDFYVTCPTNEFARRLAATGKVNVFQYVWSVKVAQLDDLPCAEWMGACSGTDTAMLFGVPFNEDAPAGLHEHRKLARQFIATIKKFVHFGAPGKQQDTPWPSYEVSKEDNEKILTNYYEFSSEKQQQPYKLDWRTNECVNVWRKYLLPSSP